MLGHHSNADDIFHLRFSHSRPVTVPVGSLVQLSIALLSCTNEDQVLPAPISYRIFFVHIEISFFRETGMWMWRHELWKNQSRLTFADWAANCSSTCRRGRSSFLAFCEIYTDFVLSARNTTYPPMRRASWPSSLIISNNPSPRKCPLQLHHLSDQKAHTIHTVPNVFPFSALPPSSSSLPSPSITQSPQLASQKLSSPSFRSSFLISPIYLRTRLLVPLVRVQLRARRGRREPGHMKEMKCSRLLAR